MRVLILCLSVCGVACPLASYAQAIHKCLAPDATAYQSGPCASDASDIVIPSPGNARAEPSPRAETSSRAESHATVSSRRAGGSSKRVFWRTSIAIGMSDDEVLNLPTWGRPGAINRSKSNHVWYEEWIYRWRLGGISRLSFANGRLTAVDTEAAAIEPETPVSLTLR